MSTEPPPVPPVFGDPTVVLGENRAAVGKGVLFGCGGCALVLLGVAAVASGICFLVLSAIANSDAVAAATARVIVSPRIQETLGTPIERGWFTTGNIQTANGASSADITIPIKGPKGGAKIHAVGYKRDGEPWVFNVLEVTISGTAERINLLQPLAATGSALEVIIRNRMIWNGHLILNYLIEVEVTHVPEKLRSVLHKGDMIHLAIHSPAMTFREHDPDYLGEWYAVVLDEAFREPYIGESEWTKLGN